MDLRKFIIWIFTVGILLVTLFYKEQVYAYILTNFVYRDEMVVKDVNQYKVNYDYSYVDNVENFTPKNKQELLNIIYTIINNGWDSYTFMCDISYESCIEDIQNLLNDNYELPNMNNFVHPYNNYANIHISIHPFQVIEIDIEKLYSEVEIVLIDNEVERIYNSIITDDMSTYDKVKSIHDYIVNNTKYLQEDDRNEYGELLFPKDSNTAYGTLINHAGNCTGYTDTMAIFLYKLGIPNYKISNIVGPIEEGRVYHIWNLLYIDGEWKHIDLTWDDPVTNSGKDVLSHDYFLLDSTTLKNLNVKDHNYNVSVYQEAKSN